MSDYQVLLLDVDLLCKKATSLYQACSEQKSPFESETLVFLALSQDLKARIEQRLVMAASGNEIRKFLLVRMLALEELMEKEKASEPYRPLQIPTAVIDLLSKGKLGRAFETLAASKGDKTSILFASQAKQIQKNEQMGLFTAFSRMHEYLKLLMRLLDVQPFASPTATVPRNMPPRKTQGSSKPRPKTALSIQDIQNLLAEGKTGEAIDGLIEHSPRTHPAFSRLILLRSRLSIYERQRNQGMPYDPRFNNQLTMAVLEILGEYH